MMTATARAAVIISAHTGGSAGSETCRGDSGTHGWKFTVGPMSLTAISVGHYDKDSDGLGAGVEVGIWDSAGVLLGSGIVPAGVGATLINDFRYVTLAAPITLLANQSYTIGSRCVGGDTVLDHLSLLGLPGDGITVASDFTAAGGRFNSQILTMLSEPTNDLGGLAYLGPNFEYGEFQSPTPTATATATHTSTASPTASDTPTDTPSATPSSTPTATPSDTPSSTPTSTPTQTPTSTATSTATSTPTHTPAPLGSGCGDGAQCESGFCVDGVCCDSRCNARGESCNFFPTPGFCAEVPTAVPAASSRGLLGAAAVLLVVAALALRARTREPGTGIGERR